MSTYTVWSFSISTRSWKEVIPLSLTVAPETIKTWRWFSKNEEKPTGRHIIILTYRRGLYGSEIKEQIPFDTYEEAMSWFNYIHGSVICGKADTQFVPPTGSSPKPKGPNLRLV